MNALMFLNLDTPIHRLNPLAKLFIVACLWITSFGSSNLVDMLIVVVYCLILWRLARIPLSGMKIFSELWPVEVLLSGSSNRLG